MEDKILDGMALALAAVVRLAVGVIFGAIDPAVGAVYDEQESRIDK